jgi:Mce-associated membrane protein
VADAVRLRRIFARQWVAMAAVVALVIVVGFEVVAFAADRGLPDAPRGSEPFVRRFAVALTSIDYRHLDADVDTILGYGGPSFVADFRSSMGATFTKNVVDGKRISKGTVVAGPTLQRVDGDTSRFVVVMNQSISSDKPGVQPVDVRLGLLVTVDGRAGSRSLRVASVQVL